MRHGFFERLRDGRPDVLGVLRWVALALLTVLSVAWGALWTVCRLALCALLVLLEPFVRIVLVPFAFLCFAVTLIFGFLMDAPHFPRWGMLAMSVVSLLLYWLYIAILEFVSRGPRGRP